MTTMSNEPTSTPPQSDLPNQPEDAIASEPSPETTPEPEPEPQATKSKEDSVLSKVGKRVIAHPLGKLMAVVIGVLFGLAIETGVGATGILGPGVDQLIAEQAEGFQNLEAKLEALRNTTDPEQAAKLTGEIETLLGRQQQLGQRTETELRVARAEIERLRAEVLEVKGATTGADIWLMPGESITVAGKAGNVFGFNSYTYSGHTSDITVNVSGERTRLKVGDAAEFPADNGTWKVIYKIAEKRSDERVGFDMVFVPTE